MENVSGITTGSNLPFLIRTTAQLMMGSKGENITDDRCWIVKTHYPQGTPFPTLPISGTKAIVIVRNPYDIITSLL